MYVRTYPRMYTSFQSAYGTVSSSSARTAYVLSTASCLACEDGEKSKIDIKKYEQASVKMMAKVKKKENI